MQIDMQLPIISLFLWPDANEVFVVVLIIILLHLRKKIRIYAKLCSYKCTLFVQPGLLIAVN